MTLNPFQRNNQIDELDMETTEALFAEILEACHAEPNETPLSVLTSYSQYRKERFTTQRVITLLLLLAFLVLPFFFMAPHISIEQIESEETTNPMYTVSIDSLLPVYKLTATIDGHNMPIYEDDNRNYTIAPTTGGDMIVTATLLNRQYNTESVSVEGGDHIAPVVVSNEIIGTNLVLYLADKGDGIDYSGIRFIADDGTETAPIRYNESLGEVIFDRPTQPGTIQVHDKAGNVLQIAVSIQ